MGEVASDAAVGEAIATWWDAAIRSVRQQSGDPGVEALSRRDFMCAHGLLIASLQQVGMVSHEDAAAYDEWAIDVFNQSSDDHDLLHRDSFESYLLEYIEQMDLGQTPADEVASFFMQLYELSGAEHRNGLLWGSSSDAESHRAFSYGVPSESDAAFEPPPSTQYADEREAAMLQGWNSRGASRERPPEMLPEDGLVGISPPNSRAGSEIATPREGGYEGEEGEEGEEAEEAEGQARPRGMRLLKAAGHAATARGAKKKSVKRAVVGMSSLGGEVGLRGPSKPRPKEEEVKDFELTGGDMDLSYQFGAFPGMGGLHSGTPSEHSRTGSHTSRVQTPSRDAPRGGEPSGTGINGTPLHGGVHDGSSQRGGSGVGRSGGARTGSRDCLSAGGADGGGSAAGATVAIGGSGSADGLGMAPGSLAMGGVGGVGSAAAGGDGVGGGSGGVGGRDGAGGAAATFSGGTARDSSGLGTSAGSKAPKGTPDDATLGKIGGERGGGRSASVSGKGLSGGSSVSQLAQGGRGTDATRADDDASATAKEGKKGTGGRGGGDGGGDTQDGVDDGEGLGDGKRKGKSKGSKRGAGDPEASDEEDAAGEGGKGRGRRKSRGRKSKEGGGGGEASSSGGAQESTNAFAGTVGHGLDSSSTHRAPKSGSKAELNFLKAQARARGEVVSDDSDEGMYGGGGRRRAQKSRGKGDAGGESDDSEEDWSAYYNRPEDPFGPMARLRRAKLRKPFALKGCDTRLEPPSPRFRLPLPFHRVDEIFDAELRATRSLPELPALESYLGERDGVLPDGMWRAGSFDWYNRPSLLHLTVEERKEIVLRKYKYRAPPEPPPARVRASVPQDKELPPLVRFDAVGHHRGVHEQHSLSQSTSAAALLPGSIAQGVRNVAQWVGGPGGAAGRHGELDARAGGNYLTETHVSKQGFPPKPKPYIATIMKATTVSADAVAAAAATAASERSRAAASSGSASTASAFTRVWKSGNVLAIDNKPSSTSIDRPPLSGFTSPTCSSTRPSIPIVRVVKPPPHEVRPLVIPSDSTASPEGMRAGALAAERASKRVGHVRLYKDEEHRWVDAAPWYLRKGEPPPRPTDTQLRGQARLPRVTTKAIGLQSSASSALSSVGNLPWPSQLAAR